MKRWKKGDIEGVVVRPLVKRKDERGWLYEAWREDWCMDCLKEMGEAKPKCVCGGHSRGYNDGECVFDKPAMVYVSSTDEGVVRGPHEHEWQTDYFVFVGAFVLRLWDARRHSTTKGRIMTIRVTGKAVVVPPGVVHAYASLADNQLVINLPDKLFAGVDRKETVDEIRHENKRRSPYDVEDMRGR